MTTRLWLAVLALAALLGCAEDKPLPQFDIVAYGDCRHREQIHRRIAAAIVRTKPKAVLVTGDLVDRPNEEPLWAAFRDIVKDLRAQADYYSAPGDHDLHPSKLFEKEMGTEALYYDKRIGDVHVFILNSMGRFTDPEQLAWLEKTAAASDAPHRFAVFHHPPFMIDRDRGAEADELRPRIHGLLVKLRFCATFCGHQHAFYTTARDGVRYVVTGGGGAPLWTLDPSLGLPDDRSRRFHHFVGLHVEPKRVRARVIDERGVEAADLAFTVCEHP
jgi:3',5'-cyclic AMP phosphodiesterase CpdA